MILPWIGKNFGKADNMFRGVRLLALGESGIAGAADVGSAPPELLRKVVQIYIDSNENWRFHRMVTTLLTGKVTAEISDNDRSEAWQSVAFCNYVPVVAASHSDERPTPKMWQQAAEHFPELLRQVEPEAILVFGYQTWGWMMHGLNGGKNWGVPNTQFADVADAVAARIMHPSRGFSFATWQPVFSELTRPVCCCRTVRRSCSSITMKRDRAPSR